MEDKEKKKEKEKEKERDCSKRRWIPKNSTHASESLWNDSRKSSTRKKFTRAVQKRVKDTTNRKTKTVHTKTSSAGSGV